MMHPDPPIPGQTPLDDISGLRIKSIRTQADLNAAEAENIRKAALKYLASRPSKRSAKFDVPWTKRLHTEMFGDVWSWAGDFRSCLLNMGSEPHQIAVDMHTLLDDLHAWPDYGMPLIEQATRLHHRAVQIHPFLNGNGRWSRLLANIWLKLHGHELVKWPETTIGTNSTIRDDYLAGVRAADEGDYRPLIALHEQYSGTGD